MHSTCLDVVPLTFLVGLITEKWEGVSVFLFMEDWDRFNARVEKFLKEHELS